LLMFSHGALAHAGFDGPRAIDASNLARLRELGGLIGLTPGLPFHGGVLELKSAIDQIAMIPFEGRAGFDGIAIGTDFLELEGTLPGLGGAPAVVDWMLANFDSAAAIPLLDGNARAFLARAAGGGGFQRSDAAT
jgi:membrane dipeptidase